MNWVWKHSRSRHGARLVLLAIADCINEDRPQDSAWPSVAELAAKTALKERAVRAAITELAVLGEIKVEYNAGPKGCNRYRVITATPAKNAGVQKLQGAESAPLQNLQGDANSQVNGRDPADSAPPAKSAPLQKTTATPAENAPGTRRNRKGSSPTEKTRPPKHVVADDLTDAFWERHKASQAQSFLAVRGIVRTAISNGLSRNEVAHALDFLAREGTAISGGSITNALKAIRSRRSANGQPGSATSTSTERARQAVEAGRQAQAMFTEGQQ